MIPKLSTNQDSNDKPLVKIKEFSTLISELKKREYKAQQKEPIDQYASSENEVINL
jgi:hypothetical protein